METPVANGSGPAYPALAVLGVLNNGTNPDLVTNYTANPLLPMTPEIFSHDADGNMTKDGLWTNVWNSENRLVKTESLSTVPEAARARQEWAYLPDGRWIERIVSTWSGGGYVPAYTNRYLWDGQVLLAVLDHNNGLVLSFMRGLDMSGTLQGAGGVGGVLAVTTHNSPLSTHFTCYDGNGNVMALASAADSSVTAEYDYDELAPVWWTPGAGGRVEV
mgnify:CR=1 FL=1